jgi:hypothetical protein
MLDPPGGTRYARSMRGYRCRRALRSRAWVALLAVTLLFVALPLSQAWAGGGRGGNWHGRGGNWHGHGHGRVFIGSSFWWGPPFPYYYYPYAYPVYVPAPAPVIVEQPVYPSPAPTAPEGSYWYYCDSAKAYYPNVPSCQEAWIKVPPRSE